MRRRARWREPNATRSGRTAPDASGAGQAPCTRERAGLTFRRHGHLGRYRCRRTRVDRRERSRQPNLGAFTSWAPHCRRRRLRATCVSRPTPTAPPQPRPGDRGRRSRTVPTSRSPDDPHDHAEPTGSTPVADGNPPEGAHRRYRTNIAGNGARDTHPRSRVFRICARIAGTAAPSP